MGEIGGAKNLDQNQSDGKNNETNDEKKEDGIKSGGVLSGLHFAESSLIMTRD